MTVDYLSTGAISNLFAQYISQANDNWGSVGEPIDGHDLFAFANANLPYLSAPNSTSVYLHFPITAVTNISLITLDGPYSIINPNPVIMPDYRQGHVHQWPTSFPSGDKGTELTTQPGGTIQLRWDDRVELTYSTVESYTVRWDKIHRWDWIIRRGGSRTMPIGTREFSQAVKPGNWRVSIRADASDSEKFWIINGGTMHCVVPDRRMPEDGLVAYYPFNGNARDESGNGHHGTIRAATLTADRFGNQNSALYFNGNSSYIDLNSKLIQNGQNFTVSLWASQMSSQSGFRELISQGYSGYSGFYIGHDSQRHFRIGDTLQFTGVPFPPINQWHHYCLVVDYLRDVTVLRVNGHSIYTATAIPVAMTGDNTFIGRQYRPGAEHFHGVIDDIRIYNRALSEEEVLLLYNEKQTGIVTLSSNQDVEYNGIAYEYWKQDDAGSAVMHLEPRGAFHVAWNNVNNFVGRSGVRPGSANEIITYAADFQPSGNAYLAGYGWSTDPLVEYYIVDSWGTFMPPGEGATFMGSTITDGGEYHIYHAERIGKPSIEGDETDFEQFWSVRTQKRTSGTITVANHFNAWSSLDMNLGTLYEVSLCVEAYQSSGTAHVHELSIGIQP